MLVYDAYPLVAVLLGEPAGAAIVTLLRESRGESGVSAINAAEVVDLVARTRRVDAASVAAMVDLWIEGGLSVIPLDWTASSRAAELRVDHYHRTRAPVSLADCAAVALAEQRDATLVSSDAAMLRVAKAVGVQVKPVPDSTGRTPTV